MKPAQIFVLLLTLGLVLASGVSAQNNCGQPCPVGAVCIENPLKACSLTALIDGIINFLFTIALVITPLMIIAGGFFFVTGGGDPAKIKRGRDLLLWTAIGFIIILLSKILVAVLKDVLKI